MTGRRRAKRDGNPTATPLGAPVDAEVSLQLALRSRLEFLLDLVQEAPVRVLRKELLRRVLNHAYLVQP